MWRKKKKEPEMKKAKPTTTWGKIWYFIWYEDSVLSWLVNIVLAIILIKFIVYPSLGLIFGTSFPVVAVVSTSMEHHMSKEVVNQQGTSTYVMCGHRFTEKVPVDFDTYWESCGDWYANLGITKEQFAGYPFKNGFNKGDIIILIGKKPEQIQVGDVIVFQAKKPYPIIHRTVNKKVGAFETKGDNNGDQIREYIIPDPKQSGYAIDAQLPPNTQPPLGSVEVLDETNVPTNRLLGKAVFRIPYLGYIKIWFVDLLHLFGITALG
jgi:signal peptidase I